MRKSEIYKMCGGPCGLVLPASDFWLDRSKTSQLTSYCRECHKEPRAAWMRDKRKQR